MIHPDDTNFESDEAKALSRSQLTDSTRILCSRDSDPLRLLSRPNGAAMLPALGVDHTDGGSKTESNGASCLKLLEEVVASLHVPIQRDSSTCPLDLSLG